ncbi:class I SAM-dependent methyltransferase [Shewanella gelidii]|nr:methyltransferase domain-containing protein [Shewanella gelidii]MCL1097467.1 methyltransferase domain-containing protein [Shewanella gelidii]
MDSHWSDYWNQGHLTSFGDSFQGNYEGVLKDCWQETFTELPEQFKVLDVATGNGALALLVRECCEGKVGTVIGVDFAKVHQPEPIAHTTIKVDLVSNKNCEALVDYESQSFDAVISQFGIEYSDFNLSLPEASRVLKPKGVLTIVSHHFQSLVIRRNERILSLIRSKETKQLLETMARLVKAMGEVREPEDIARVKANETCETIRKELNSTINQLVKNDEDALKDSELMSYVATIFQKGMLWPLAEKLRYLDFVKQQILALELRLKELTDASIDENQLGELISKLNKFGLTLVAVKVLKTAEKQIVSWFIQAEKL